jgi:hypothetical protein
VLRDAENQHGLGINDSDRESRESEWRTGEVSPVIGKAPGIPVLVRTMGLWFTAKSGPAVIYVAGSLSVKVDRAAGTWSGMR